MISLQEIEHEFDPTVENYGRGVLISKDEVQEIDVSGYAPVDSQGVREFRIYGADGTPSRRVWRGFVRQENGRHYCAAVEYLTV